MKTRIFLTSLLVITGMMASGQRSNLELTFTAVDSVAHVQLDSIKIMNRSWGGEFMIYWPDTSILIEIYPDDLLLYIGYSTGLPVGVGEIRQEKDRFELFQNYPNPVKDHTLISLFIPDKGKVNIIVTDIQGRMLLTVDRQLNKGRHAFRFTPGDDGIYFITARWNAISRSIKILAAGTGSGNRCMLDYAGGFAGEPRQKVSAARDGVRKESGILDSPTTDKFYTFQFATNIPCPGIPTVEYDGQVYNTIQIFSQCWLKENLNVGTMIPGSQAQSDNGAIEKYCYDNNESNCITYGGLYRWNEMMQYITQQGTQGICPSGWHLPTEEEWKVLEGAADSQFGIGDPEWDLVGDWRGYDACTNLKTTTGWLSGYNGTDLFGFSGLPGGSRFLDNFSMIGLSGFWWSSTEVMPEAATGREFRYDYSNVLLLNYYKEVGFSVRCVSGIYNPGGSPENLVAHWLFNGDADDATGNGNNGTPTAGHPFFGGGPAPQLATDRFGNANYCYHFDQGSNIEVPYSTELNPQALTISLWINMEEQPNNDYIIAMNRWNGWKLNIQDVNFLFFTVKAIYNNDTVWYDRDSNPYAVAADTWTQVAVTFTDGFMNFYINGELVKAWDNTSGIPIAVDNINLTIGSDLPTSVYTTEEGDFYVNWGGYFKGDIDDVRLYNTALTASQIDSVYTYEKDNVVEDR